ncbi:uncharacterized protein EAF01_003820 [Botrytis porri]|uniref:Uncharacterized protein n=1 Tax=Botrytis porri TaxID=87229 RepID=A0A4Z1KMN3_9HELO|nr:uncharacterized protein EAF01_003820 [Botrytis porri]KAF7908065.1 hypothetical protein EAF01_003820 [Botrytis porri]TGO82649.1 hypothetical protein BPOR_0784g00010 [Botrytis porri]
MLLSTLITSYMAVLAVASPLRPRSINDVVVNEDSPSPLIEWSNTKRIARTTADEGEGSPAPIIEWADTKKTARAVSNEGEIVPTPLIE